ncbi:MAG: diguanylate cyclase [Desulfobulbaceae bacterium]|nr:diguanylate cyclase [Desulfobulbaceae bacterium]
MTEYQEKTGTILIVDDTPANVSLLNAVLSEEYRIRTATRGSEALKIALETPPDLILLDIMMPEMDGYEVCERLKESPQLRDIPVIFLSLLDSTEVKVKAFRSGGVDYITKPFHAEEVRARVRTHLRIRRLQLQLEAQNQVLEQIDAERTRLAMIVESSNDAIFTVSVDSVITSWNGGAEDIFGYSAREIIGKPIFTIMPAERYHERSHIWQTILSGEQLQYFETTRIRKDGKKVYVTITTSPLLNTDGEIIGNSVIARDVTERRQLEETIRHQAHYDTLTDLPNRQLFMDLLSLELVKAQRNGKKLALLFMDLNGFKLVNDTLGHSCGDHLLQEVARRLKASIRLSDTVARLGGDEFTVLMPDLTQRDDVDIVLGKIRGVFETPFILEGVAVETSASIGISMFPDNGDCSDNLIKKADSAMYAAKGSGKNSHQFYTAKVMAEKTPFRTETS